MFGSNRRALTALGRIPPRALWLDDFQDTRYLRKVFGKASRRGQRDRQPERKDDPVAISSPVHVAIAMTPLSRKGNKRRATNRRGWRQRHVAVVLCSSRLVSLERRGHEKKKKGTDGGEKGEKWRLLIPQDRNPAYEIHLTLRFLIEGTEKFTSVFSNYISNVMKEYNFSNSFYLTYFLLQILLYIVIKIRVLQ